MSFANHYLSKQTFVNLNLSETASPDLKYCIVIPCYNEDKLPVTLDSLWKCRRPASGVEAVIVVNSSESDNRAVIRQNLNTINEFKKWQSLHSDPDFRFHLLHIQNLPAKHAGAGLARKTGMDAAIHRFNALNRPDGIIISFDADCTCDDNYLTEIESAFLENNKADCAILYFEHRVSGDEFPPEIYAGIVQYELHLRYHIESLRFIKYPFAFHTLGSCFAVKANAYIRQGGMNRRKAGEDFYFLQKMFTSGHITEINHTKVYPSPRPSLRVPFGTGPVIHKMCSSKHFLMKTYNPNSYLDLGRFLRIIPQLYGAGQSKWRSLITEMPDSVREFLLCMSAEAKLDEVNRNTGNSKAFVKRFFNWFNGLMLVKYLNYSHAKHYAKIPVEEAAFILLKERKAGAEYRNGALELLKIYRKLQQRQNDTIPL
ncbi:MAG: glycosyltransferase [Bacteroidales bacterium]|nr:glycosyltransferase [Bacteroidales bacterium]